MTWQEILAIALGVYGVLMSLQWARIRRAVKEWREAIEVTRESLTDGRVTTEEAAAILKETSEAVRVTLPLVHELLAAWRGLSRLVGIKGRIR